MSRLRIAGGHLVDPAHGVDGVADVWVEGGRVVEAPSGAMAASTAVP